MTFSVWRTIKTTNKRIIQCTIAGFTHRFCVHRSTWIPLFAVRIENTNIRIKRRGRLRYLLLRRARFSTGHLNFRIFFISETIKYLLRRCIRQQTCDQKNCTTSEIAADWHQLMTIPQRTMRPSVALVSGPRISQQTYDPPPQSATLYAVYATHCSLPTPVRVGGWVFVAANVPEHAQKLRTPRNGLVAPIQKASSSVSEVMVIDTAAERRVLAMRTSVSSRGFVARHSIISWNMSSAPMPVHRPAHVNISHSYKKRTVCRVGQKSKPPIWLYVGLFRENVNTNAVWSRITTTKTTGFTKQVKY